MRQASTLDFVVSQECKPTFDICGAGTVEVDWPENYWSKISIWRAGSASVFSAFDGNAIYGGSEELRSYLNKSKIFNKLLLCCIDLYYELFFALF